MTDRDERTLWERIGAEYNPPLETPREEMWRAVERRISTATDPGKSGAVRGSGQVASGSGQGSSGRSGSAIDLESARSRHFGAATGRKSLRPVFGWAAAALLVLGIGIGRMSAPTATMADASSASTPSPTAGGNGLAARAHLGRSEALLTMVRADARDGRVDPAVAEWAEDLLAQTRLLLDRPNGVERGMQDLLLDLELVLVQVVGLAKSDRDDEQARAEVQLTLKALDEGDVLPRIQAQIPPTMAGA